MIVLPKFTENGIFVSIASRSRTFGTKYSGMDQVKFMEDSLLKNFTWTFWILCPICTIQWLETKMLEINWCALR